MAALCGAPAGMAESDPSHGQPTHHVRFSSVSLPADTRVDGILVSEISGLTWDPEAQVLYAISDSGNLFRFRLAMENGALRAVVPVSAVAMQRLPGEKGKPTALDAEGLALRKVQAGDRQRVELLVATEGMPKVWRVDPAGTVLGELPLPAQLTDAKRYEARNTMLEAVAVHPAHGLLVAPERPLRGEDPLNGHRIHAHDRHWNIEAFDPLDSRLKAMEVLENGQLLVLERAGSGKRMVNALRRTDLNACNAPATCAAQTLVHIDRDGGAENFEGMAYLGRQQVLLASDNRGKKHSDTVFLLVDLSQFAVEGPKKPGSDRGDRE
jgi:hypothetical protein